MHNTSTLQFNCRYVQKPATLSCGGASDEVFFYVTGETIQPGAEYQVIQRVEISYMIEKAGVPGVQTPATTEGLFAAIPGLRTLIGHEGRK